MVLHYSCSVKQCDTGTCVVYGFMVMRAHHTTGLDNCCANHCTHTQTSQCVYIITHSEKVTLVCWLLSLCLPTTTLAVPQKLHCGHCLAGQSRAVVFKCDNFGGEGNFKLFPLEDSIQDNNEVASNVSNSTLCQASRQ